VACFKLLSSATCVHACVLYVATSGSLANGRNAQRRSTVVVDYRTELFSVSEFTVSASPMLVYSTVDSGLTIT